MLGGGELVAQLQNRGGDGFPLPFHTITISSQLPLHTITVSSFRFGQAQWKCYLRKSHQQMAEMLSARLVTPVCM